MGCEAVDKCTFTAQTMLFKGQPYSTFLLLGKILIRDYSSIFQHSKSWKDIFHIICFKRPAKFFTLQIGNLIFPYSFFFFIFSMYNLHTVNLTFLDTILCVLTNTFVWTIPIIKFCHLPKFFHFPCSHSLLSPQSFATTDLYFVPLILRRTCNLNNVFLLLLTL